MKQKKQTKKWRTVVGGVVLSLALVGCGSLPFLQGNSGVLEEKTNVLLTGAQNHIAVDYVDYDKVIAGPDAPYANDPRYADVTPDGLIDWRQKQQFEERPDLPQILEHVTLNGKPVQFPMTFADLNPDYAAFGKMSLKNVTDENLTLVIKNTQNHSQVVFDVAPFGPEDKLHLANIEQYGVAQIETYFREKGHNQEHEIIGLESDISIFPTMSDVRVKGIGVGNTLNEMYEAFGKPTYVTIMNEERLFVSYYFNNGKYDLTFYCDRKINDPFGTDKVNVYPNTITSVSLTKENTNNN